MCVCCEVVNSWRARRSPSHTCALHQQGKAIEAHGPDTHLLIRKNLHKRQLTDFFRSAIAFALALDRLVPEHQRSVTNEARIRNTATVPAFTDAQLLDPLTALKAKDDTSLDFAFPSLKSWLDMAQLRQAPSNATATASSSAAASSSGTAASTRGRRCPTSVCIASHIHLLIVS